MHAGNYNSLKHGHDPLSLDRIRGILNRLEDTIIFALIERAQFAYNPRIYQPRAFEELSQLGFGGSWLEWFIFGVESFHAQGRRYTSPDEYPFTQLSKLPAPVLAPLQLPEILHPNDVNVNPKILEHYITALVPRLTRHSNGGTEHRNGAEEDDGNYGSSATIDIEILQSISKRVHYGKFVSESKFRSSPSTFIPAILARDRPALDALITKPAVEHALLTRLRRKAAAYAQDFESGSGGEDENKTFKVDVDGVVELYEHFIIPLTKEVEIEYLLQRLSSFTQEEIDGLCQSPPQTQL